MAFMCGKCSEAFASFSDWRSHMAVVKYNLLFILIKLCGNHVIYYLFYFFLKIHEIVMGVKDTIENEELNGGPPVDLEAMQKKSKPQIAQKAKYVIPIKEKKIMYVV